MFELKDSLIQVKEYMTAVYGVKANKNLEELRNQANICILIDKIPNCDPVLIKGSYCGIGFPT